MVLQAKKGVPDPKVETRAKALKAKEAVLKGFHCHKEKDPNTTHIPKAQYPEALQEAHMSLSEHPQEKQA